MTSDALLLAVLIGVLAGVAGLVVGWWLGRGGRADLDAERDAAVSAAVAAVLAEREATATAVVADRDATVRAAVEVAGARLDDKLKVGASLIDQRSKSFEEQVEFMNRQLDSVRKLVGDLQADKARQHGEVLTKLESAARVTTELSRTTQGLREALANSRARGQWGERMAADVLRAAGFVEGVNYRTQTAVASGRVPDFTFLLPRGLELNMDVKFPIDNYLRYLDTQGSDQDAARNAFLRDVRARVKEITTRDYIDPERTVDHVLLFIPNESVYSFIHEQDPRLLDTALQQRVVLCSPSTLFAVLAVVRQSVDQHQLERTSSDILKLLAQFRGQWGKFADQVDKLERSLESVNKAFDELNGTRRRTMERVLDRIDDLSGEPDDESPVRALKAG